MSAVRKSVSSAAAAGPQSSAASAGVTNGQEGTKPALPNGASAAPDKR